MRTPLVLPAIALCLFPFRALAATDLSAPPGAGLGAVGVHVDLAKRLLAVRVCGAAPCVPAAGAADQQTIDLPLGADDAPKDADVVLEKISIGNGKDVVRVRIPVAARNAAFEAIVAGQKPNPVLWSGWTGFTKGETGERTGEAIAIEEGQGGAKFVIVGDVREDATLCGKQATLLSPRTLDPNTLAWRGITYQRLSKEQRAQANRVVASAHGAPAEKPLAPLLRATAASTGTATALTDGDPNTVWTEGRPGIGQGEFVVMRAPGEVAVTKLAITVAPPGTPPATGAAPKSFYLVTDKTTYHVTLPEDGWMHAGDAYEIPFVDPIQTSCVAVVLDDAYDHGRPKPDVSIAEIAAYSAFDAPHATLDSVVAALSGGGARANAAAAVLKRAGKAGVGSLHGGYEKLDAEGRALAMDVAAAAEDCAGSTVLVDGLVENARIASKARGKLERCGKQAAPAYVDALKGPDLGLRAKVAPLFASAAPSLALDPIANALDRGTPEVRAALRSAFAKAAESAPVDKLAEIMMDASRPNDARIDILRASSSRLADMRGEASGAIAALLLPGATTRTRYLLAAPLATLARAGDEPSEQRYLQLLTADLEPAVRAHAAEVGEGIAPSALTAALKDPEPRVREAALRGLAAGKHAQALSQASELLARDKWSFVRVAAAGFLATIPPHPGVDQVLASSLMDGSPRVRRAILAALAARKATTQEKVVLGRVDDPTEDAEVRVAAAQALGDLCARGATERLTKLASAAGSPTLDDVEVQLAMASIQALGKLHPADLSTRLGKLLDPAVRPEVRRVVDAALKETEVCK